MACAPGGMLMGGGTDGIGHVPTTSEAAAGQSLAMSYLNTTPPAGANYGAVPGSSYADLGLAGGSGFGSEYGTGYGPGAAGPGNYSAGGYNSAGYYSAAYGASCGAVPGSGACPGTAGAIYGAQGPYASVASFGYGGNPGGAYGAQGPYASTPGFNSAASLGCGGCFPGGAAGPTAPYYPGSMAVPQSFNGACGTMPLPPQSGMMTAPFMTMGPCGYGPPPTAGPSSAEVVGMIGHADKSLFSTRPKKGSGRSKSAKAKGGRRSKGCC